MPEKNVPALTKESLRSRRSLKNLLLDIYAGDRLTVNLLLAAYDSGIVAQIDRADTVDEAFATAAGKSLAANYGLTEQNAGTAVRFWIQEYAEKMAGKPVSLPDGFDSALPASREGEAPAPQSVKKHPSHAPKPAPIDISSFRVGQKLPPSVFARNTKRERELGISSLSLTSYVSSSCSSMVWIRITGRIRGGSDPKTKYARSLSHSFDLVIHNENGKPIGMDRDNSFEEKDMYNTHLFEETISIRKDEKIRDISINFI